MIPETSRETLLDAMARFDREERASREWQEWEQGRYGAHTAAIRECGRLYPVKRIVAMAAGVSYRSFHGGDNLNEYVRERGFTVIGLRRDDKPRVWWVNQGQEFANERAAGHIQAPVVDARRSHLKHWDALEEVQTDDLIVHCGRGYIRAVGRALGVHEQATVADGRAARRVPVEYADLDPPVALDAVASMLHALQIPDGPLVQSGQHPKQGYLWPFSADGLRIIRDASTAAWPSWAMPTSTQTQAWIFQGDPNQFEIEAALRELPQIYWGVRQHADKIRSGDRVYFWISGPDAGIVAVGTILADPGDRESDEDERRFYRDPEKFEGARRQVPIRIDEVLPERIRRSEFREHPVLRDLTILQLAQGTNFIVRPDQAAALQALIAQRLPGASEPMLDEPLIERNPPIQFSSLLHTLEEDGLYFPAELVSNHLLALQTKRFVILTGISGTGKTQLALAVARAFQPQVQVDVTRRAAEGAVEQIVQPYMVKYHRLVLPQALRANMTLPTLAPERTSSQIDVLYPAGKTTLRFNLDPNRPVVQLLFSGEFRAWFDSELQVGDRFQLDVVPRDGDGVDSLRFSRPIVETREEPLDNYRVIAVRPDWTDNRGLLGYHNPLTEQYTTTTLLDLLLRADAECERAKREGGRRPYPFFAILDEMNLAHVEHYISDFLSAMESGEAIDLHGDAALEAGEGSEGTPMPRRLKIPPNVFFTGTVNVDETTSMFSPKVLDRAFTIELDQVNLSEYGDVGGPSDVSAGESSASALRLESFPGMLDPWRKPDTDDWREFSGLCGGALHRTVLDLHDLLARNHRHFGYRVTNEVARFVTLAAEQANGQPQTLWAGLDLAILEKVLPKFHGTQQELEEPLRSLFTFFVTRKSTGGSTGATSETSWMLQGTRLVPAGLEPPVVEDPTDGGPATTSASTPAFPRSAAKVWRMLERLRQQGFTSFIE